MILQSNQINLVEIVRRNCDAPLQYSLKREKSYFEQYPALRYAAIEVMKSRDNRELLLLEMAVYAWMPQIIRCRPTSVLDNKGLQELLSGRIRDADALVQMCSMPLAKGHSWVALSKVLHFIEPESFAIWDSRVASCFGLKWSSQWNRLDVYTSYLRILTHLANETPAEIAEIKAHVARVCGYEISTLRSLELMLFLEGARQANLKGSLG
jgi:hypothetical protein